MNLIACLTASLNSLASLPWLRHGARPAAAPQTEAVSPADETAAEEDELPPQACGWYDSSHDLSHGLTVREDLSAAELPLANWLEIHLGGWRAAAQPA